MADASVMEAVKAARAKRKPRAPAQAQPRPQAARDQEVDYLYGQMTEAEKAQVAQIRRQGADPNVAVRQVARLRHADPYAKSETSRGEQVAAGAAHAGDMMALGQTANLRRAGNYAVGRLKGEDEDTAMQRGLAAGDDTELELEAAQERNPKAATAGKVIGVAAPIAAGVVTGAAPLSAAATTAARSPRLARFGAGLVESGTEGAALGGAAAQNPDDLERSAAVGGTIGVAAPTTISAIRAAPAAARAVPGAIRTAARRGGDALVWSSDKLDNLHPLTRMAVMGGTGGNSEVAAGLGKAIKIHRAKQAARAAPAAPQEPDWLQRADDVAQPGRVDPSGLELARPTRAPHDNPEIEKALADLKASMGGPPTAAPPMAVRDVPSRPLPPVADPDAARLANVPDRLQQALKRIDPDTTPPPDKTRGGRMKRPPSPPPPRPEDALPARPAYDLDAALAEAQGVVRSRNAPTPQAQPTVRAPMSYREGQLLPEQAFADSPAEHLPLPESKAGVWNRRTDMRGNALGRDPNDPNWLRDPPPEEVFKRAMATSPGMPATSGGALRRTSPTTSPADSLLGDARKMQPGGKLGWQRNLSSTPSLQSPRDEQIAFLKDLIEQTRADPLVIRSAAAQLGIPADVVEAALAR